MKTFLSISVLITFVYIQLFNGFIWMSYEMNKSEIIQQFCVNKDKPELQCEGKCHMKDMMLSEEDEEEGEPLIMLPDIQLCSLELGKDFFKAERIIHWTDPYSNLYAFYFLNDVENPPKV